MITLRRILPLRVTGAPTLLLWLFAIAFGIICGLAPDGELPKRADLVSRLAFCLIVAFWVSTDARKRGRTLSYDYDTLVFLAAPVYVPIYLFQTRGLRALLTLLWFALIWLLVGLIAGTLIWLRAE